MKNKRIYYIRKVSFLLFKTVNVNTYCINNSFVFVLISLIFLLGCGPDIGGGGSVHIPPEIIRVGEPTVIKLELSVWGQGYGKISKRYTKVQCHYKNDMNNDFKTIDMVLTQENSKTALFICTLPPFRTSGQLEYYFTMLLDGHENRRDEKPIPIRNE